MSHFPSHSCTTAMLVCKNCFYKYRCQPGDIASRCSHTADVPVKWNEGEELYETVNVRNPPRDLINRVLGNVRLCNPRMGSCRRDDCIFAHGEAEQRKWNSILWVERKRGERPISKCMDMQMLFALIVYSQ